MNIIIFKDTGKCDHCSKFTKIEFKEKKHPNEIIETYFECEHCHHRYVCFVTDKKVRKMQRKKNGLKGNYNFQKRLDLQEEINERMDKLKHNLIEFGRAGV